MTRLSIRTVCITCLTALCGWLHAGPAVAAVTAPGYLESPLFYERFADNYSDPKNLDLFPQGVVRLDPIGTENIDRFDWVRHARQDKSFWQRIEAFDYLLPLVLSDEPQHHSLVLKWFKTWYAVHSRNAQPNVGAWDGMTAGRRAMIFAVILRRELQRPQPDQEAVDGLKNAIGLHQQFLANPDNFETLSNHGMWEALGLFETTRVLPDTALSRLALDRMLALTRTSVSSQGVHLEHSPSYHFYFLQWLADFAGYLQQLGDIGWNGADELVAIDNSMHEAAYFLFDHDGNLPQIGDTDATRLSPEEMAQYPTRGATLFDSEAGFAVFKDPPSAPKSRYIVMRIENRHHEPKLRHHCHNDVLSVYYARDGEVILSDQGRYSYERTPIRGYLMSLAAHNTILPSSMVVPKQPGIYVCEEVWQNVDGSPVEFGAQLVNQVVKRSVFVPRDQGRFLVDDVIRAGDEFLMLWYLGPDVARIDPGQESTIDEMRYYEWTLTTKKGGKVKVQISVEGENQTDKPEVALVRGQEKPYLGWYSPAYNKLEPASVITLLLKPKDEIHVTTEVRDTR